MTKLNLTSSDSIKISEYERQVRSIEGFPIIIRQSSTLHLDAYTFQRAASASLRVGEYLQKRIKPNVADAEVICLKPDGTVAPKNMVIGTLRRLHEQHALMFGKAV